MSTPSAEPAPGIRPSRSVRTIGVALGLFGTFFGLSGFAAGSDVVGGLLVGACGCLLLLVGFSTFRARAWVEEGQLGSRFIRTTRIPAAQIRSLSVDAHGQGSNIYIRVERLDRRRPAWLPATGRFDTRRSRALLEQQIQALRAALRLGNGH